MKKHSDNFKYAGSILALSSCFFSPYAAAALQNLHLQVDVKLMESLDLVNLTSCPAGTFAVGTSAGIGNIIVTTSNIKESIKIPVKIAATDCADAAFNFSNGFFTLTALAPSGDMLNATYHGSFIPVNTTGALKLNTGAFSITAGGTGIFSGASGSGQLQGEGQLLGPTTFEANLRGNGKISFSKTNFEEKYKIPPMPQ